LLRGYPVDVGLEEGRTAYAIGKDLSVWIEKLFNTHIKPGTIEKRAQRKRGQAVRTNVCSKSPQKTPASEVVDSIKSGHMSDVEAKQIGDALADGITKTH